MLICKSFCFVESLSRSSLAFNQNHFLITGDTASQKFLMLSFRPRGFCKSCATIQTEIWILSLLVFSFPIPNPGLMKTSHTFGLMIFQNCVATTGNVTIAKILLYRLVQNGLTLVFGTIGLVCFVRTRVAFMDALLNQGLTGWHTSMPEKIPCVVGQILRVCLYIFYVPIFGIKKCIILYYTIMFLQHKK